MWQTNRQQLNKDKKINVNFTIDKNLYEQFKKVAQKDMRKYSNIVEGSMRRYVRSKLQFFHLEQIDFKILSYTDPGGEDLHSTSG